MLELSEFVGFVAEKSGINKPGLIEKDVILHRILKKFYAQSQFTDNYVFKGGSCLVKCFYGYYRFSVDLDFTWLRQEAWSGLTSNQLRRKLLVEIDTLGSFLEETCSDMGIEFINDSRNRRYFDFGGGTRMTTFKLWKNSELIKIQVNYVEDILFPKKEANVKTLLDNTPIKQDDKAYFQEFLKFYSPFKAPVYDEREIVCEKVRATLTRLAQKLNDFYDLFMLDKAGFHVDELNDKIAHKIEACLRYRKYRRSLEKNKQSLSIDNVLGDPYGRSLLIKEPGVDFEMYIKKLEKSLTELMKKI